MYTFKYLKFVKVEIPRYFYQNAIMASIKLNTRIFRAYIDMDNKTLQASVQTTM